MSKSPDSLEFGLKFSAILFSAGVFICVFIFPFVFTPYGYSLMLIVLAIAFIAFYIPSKKIYASFKENPTTIKQIWCSLDYLLPVTAWLISNHISTPWRDILFFVAFGYLADSLIAKIFIRKEYLQQK
jgi:hypothetical protein